MKELNNSGVFFTATERSTNYLWLIDRLFIFWWWLLSSFTIELYDDGLLDCIILMLYHILMMIMVRVWPMRLIHTPEGRWSIIWGWYCVWRQMKHYLRLVLYLKACEVLFDVCIVYEGRWSINWGLYCNWRKCSLLINAACHIHCMTHLHLKFCRDLWSDRTGTT
jgi:hypothetical protein